MILRSTALLAAALLLAGAAPCAFAEDEKPAAVASGASRARLSPEERVKQLKERLNLSDEQASKITVIYQKSGEKMKALRDDASLTPETRRQKFIEGLRETVTEVNPLLTPEQQSKWKEMQQKRLEELQQLRPGTPEAKPK